MKLFSGTCSFLVELGTPLGYSDHMNATNKNKVGYLLNKNSEVIAIVTGVKAGEVRYSYTLCEERIDRSRTHNLVDARTGRISYARKYAKCHTTLVAREIIFERELFVS